MQTNNIEVSPWKIFPGTLFLEDLMDFHHTFDKGPTTIEANKA
jgi:hypothetical protein